MIASDLSPDLWQAVIDLVNRSRSAREIFFQYVIRRDITDKLIWTAEYADTPIPLFGFDYLIYYYDTVAGGGPPFDKNTVVRREAITQVQVPKIGELVAILDMWGAQSQPICIGKVYSTGNYWDSATEEG